MTVGARIRNSGGSLVQIDPFYENLALKTLGSVTTAQLDSSGVAANCGRAVVNVGGCNQPLLAVACSSAFVGLRQRTQAGSTYTWELISSAPVVAISYWVFDTTDVAQMAFVTSKGLRIRNPGNGRVVFDSRYKYMRVIGLVQGTAGTSQTDYAIGQTDGFAVGLGHTGASLSVISGPIGGGSTWQQDVHAYVAGFRTGSGVVSAKAIETAFASNSGSGVAPPAGTFGTFQVAGIVCDVRNY